MRRKIALALALSVISNPAPAQEREFPWLVRTGIQLFQRLTAPNKQLDSTHVLQLPQLWEVAAEGKTIRLQADLGSAITVRDFTGDEAKVITGTMNSALRNQPYWKTGLAVGFGPLRLAFGVDLAKKKDSRNKYFSLGTRTSFYGAEIEYYDIEQYPGGQMAFEGSDPVDLNSEYMGHMRDLALDGFYAFNRHRFIYNAAYGGKVLQRRSAGSWMVTAKYLQGEFSVHDDDPIWKELNDLQRYTTQQVSLGGGYSFNWVPVHRDPTDRKTLRNLRNLTLNATVLPMVSFYNHIQTEQATEDGSVKVRFKGQPSLSPILRGALCYTFGRWSVNLNVDYDRFSFQGVETDVSQQDGHYRSTVKTDGVFSNLTAEAKLHVRF